MQRLHPLPLLFSPVSNYYPQALGEALGTGFGAPRAEVMLAAPRDLDARAEELRASGRRALVLRLPDSPEAAARELYRSLREADASGVDVVVTALPSESGLGRAVADRLRKAAGPRVTRGGTALPRGE